MIVLSAAMLLPLCTGIYYQERPRITQTGRLLLSIYAIFTLVEFVALVFVGMPPYDAISHAFTTLPSGGFSPKGASIQYYDSIGIETVIMIFMFIAGVNFVLFYKAFIHLIPIFSHQVKDKNGNKSRTFGSIDKLKRTITAFRINTEFIGYLLIVLITTFMVIGILIHEQNQEFASAFRDGLFTVLSVISTTGYTTVDFGGWPSMAEFLLLLLMFTGACAGSTAGGIKLVRFQVLLKGLHRDFVRAIHPQIVKSIRLDGNTILKDVVSKVSFYFFLYMLTFLIGTMLVLVFEPSWNFMEGMSAVATSKANIGPALGTAEPSFNFNSVTSETKPTLIFLMWLGRLEIITPLMLFFPSIYKERT